MFLLEKSQRNESMIRKDGDLRGKECNHVDFLKYFRAFLVVAVLLPWVFLFSGTLPLQH